MRVDATPVVIGSHWHHGGFHEASPTLLLLLLLLKCVVFRTREPLDGPKQFPSVGVPTRSHRVENDVFDTLFFFVYRACYFQPNEGFPSLITRKYRLGHTVWHVSFSLSSSYSSSSWLSIRFHFGEGVSKVRRDVNSHPSSPLEGPLLRIGRHYRVRSSLCDN